MLKSIRGWGVSLLLIIISQISSSAKEPETLVELMQRLVDDEKDCKILLQSAKGASEIEYSVASELIAASGMARAYAFCVNNLSDIYFSVDAESRNVIRPTIVSYLSLVKEDLEHCEKQCNLAIGFSKRPGTVSDAESLRKIFEC